MMRWIGVALVGFMALAQTSIATARVALEQLDSVVLPGDEVEIRLGFDGDAPEPVAYQIDKPARIVFDLVGATSKLAGKYHNLGNGNARSVTVLDTRERTRVIVNLSELSGHEVRVDGNQLYINIGKSRVAKAAGSTAKTVSLPSSSASSVKSVTGVDFRRGEQGDGQVLIDLSTGAIPVDVQQQGNKIVVKFVGAKVPDGLRRRLDVTDFATPVKSVDAFNDGANGMMTILPQGEFEYLAYQTDSKLTISVKPITKDDKRKRQDFAYSGEKLSLNFQDIEVRSVLQLIADFTSLNLVASDSVSGKITLRLQNVPWDQALDLILKTKALDKRTIGNVMLVAPADEIAARERLEMESNNQSEKLAALRSEFIQVNYAKASDMLGLISGPSRLLSERGSASVDSRTNTLIILDTAKRIEEIRDVVLRLDVPVKQVMIEARIVLASTNFAKELGVKWGLGRDDFHRNRRYTAAGSRQTLGEIRASELEQVSLGNQSFIQRTYEITQPDDLAVDLGVDKAGASSLAIGLIDTDNVVLDLELSALQSDGNGEVVATPKVLTADKQKARIATGKQIPYQEASSSGATAVRFINAELSLEVTPSITPDGRINMELLVNNDSIGEILPNGAVTINTNRVTTNVLVDDGQTVVLGGVFKTETAKGVTKTPFLGDIPYLGRLFRRDVTRNDKQELLIFVTPRLATEAIASK
ncbi:MAG: type IV pilus secretin PilQ family protein [Moraxellaceae bacterium]|nr:type IV pilus secretin PilQ family protein [Moraxellaceae bacterium]